MYLPFLLQAHSFSPHSCLVLPKVYAFILFSLLLGVSSFFKNSRSVRWDRLAVSVYLFIGYLLVATVVIGGRSLEILKLVGFLLLFLYFKGSELDNKHLNVVIVLLYLSQAIYGLLQYFQVVHVSSAFPIVGSFDNPAGFAACLAVAFPLAFSLFKQSGYYRWLAIVAMLVMACAVVLSESRAGIVSVGVVCAIFFFTQLPERLKKFRKLLIPLFLVVGVVAFLLLLSMKQDSVSGRVLIWQSTWAMIQDAPIFGHGNGAFLAHYMNYQADYFAQNPESRFAMLADNVLHPFNEYLLLVAEFGLVGLALLLIALFFLFKSAKMDSPYLLCLMALAVFSLFSYPLKYPFVWVVAAYCVAQISKQQTAIFTLSFWKWLKIPALAGLLIGVYFLAKDISFEYQWNKIAQRSLVGKTVEMMPEYERLHPRWNGNPLFLFNYGAELHHIGRHEKSNIVFHQCLRYFNDYDVQMLLADNYFHLERWDRAEYHFIRAANMCPVRFRPLGRLMNLYYTMGRYEEALEMAVKIRGKPVKVMSATVRRIQLEAEEMMENLRVPLYRR